MSYRINWEKLVNKQIGKFNPDANQYFKNNHDHFQFLALVKVIYEKQSILTVTEFKKNFYDACQQRIGQFEIDNERSEHFGCLISITFIQLFICKKNNFKLDKNINEILKKKNYNHHLWKTGKKYNLKHLNKIISVFDKFYNHDKKETNVEERRIMFSFKNDEYLNLTKSDKLIYDNKIYNKYFKSYVEDMPEESNEDSSDEESNEPTLEIEENQNNEESGDEEDLSDESDDEEPTESDDDFIVDDNHIEYHSGLIEDLKEENKNLVIENEDLIKNNKVLKKNLNTSEQLERNNKRKISVLKQNERNYILRISQLEEREKTYLQMKKHYEIVVSQLQESVTNKKRRIDTLEDKNDELENKNDELENNHYYLNEENENLRKRLKIEGQYANYWLGGKSKEYTPFLNWPKDEDL